MGSRRRQWAVSRKRVSRSLHRSSFPPILLCQKKKYLRVLGGVGLSHCHIFVHMVVVRGSDGGGGGGRAFTANFRGRGSDGRNVLSLSCAAVVGKVEGADRLHDLR